MEDKIFLLNRRSIERSDFINFLTHVMLLIYEDEDSDVWVVWRRSLEHTQIIPAHRRGSNILVPKNLDYKMKVSYYCWESIFTSHGQYWSNTHLSSSNSYYQHYP